MGSCRAAKEKWFARHCCSAEGRVSEASRSVFVGWMHARHQLERRRHFWVLSVTSGVMGVVGSPKIGSRRSHASKTQYLPMCVVCSVHCSHHTSSSGDDGCVRRANEPWIKLCASKVFYGPAPRKDLSNANKWVGGCSVRSAYARLVDLRQTRFGGVRICCRNNQKLAARTDEGPWTASCTSPAHRIVTAPETVRTARTTKKTLVISCHRWRGYGV